MISRRGSLVLVGVFLTIVAATTYYWYQEKQRHTFHVWFLNIGQGDSSLIQFADGTTMLVDCGPDKKVLSELGSVLPVYVRTINYLLITHPDLDHYGGCIDVLKRYQVMSVVTNGKTKEDTYWKAWSKTLLDTGATAITMSTPTTWRIANDTLTFLSPDTSLFLGKEISSNNTSIVFRLTHENTSYMFTGDMEAELERALISKYCPNHLTDFNLYDDDSSSCPQLRADILKVGHHGSPGSSTELFLRLVRPRTAIISVGKNNRYKHPSLRIIRRLERHTIAILRTDLQGAILMQ